MMAVEKMESQVERFHVIDDAAVIVRNKSVFRQVKVFRRGDDLYASHGSGFIRLYKGGGTGLTTVSWDDIDLPIDGFDKSNLMADAHGKLSLAKAMKLIEAKTA